MNILTEELEKEETFLLDKAWQKEIEIINLYYKNLKRIKKNAKKSKQVPSIEEIKRSLKDNLGEDPLKLWEKDQARCEILLKDPKKNYQSQINTIFSSRSRRI